MNLKLPVVLLTTLLFTACNDVVFMECTELPSEGWNKDAPCVFEVPITEVNATYQMQIIVRNNANYQNQNLWLFVDQTEPNKTVTRDTIQFFLADNSGRWTGSGVGSIFENVWIYKERVRYKEAGTYKISISQGMRYDQLEGICDLGVKIIKTN